MEGSQDTTEHRRAQRFIAMARDRLAEAARMGADPSVMEQASRYLSDAQYHLEKGDEATALASASYSHGLLDGCLGLGEARAQQTSLLAKVFINELRGAALAKDLASSLGISDDSLTIILDMLQRQGLVALNGQRIQLTAAGRSKLKIGLVAGVFDLIHPGHIALLRWAKNRVDVLTVIVARDPSSQMRKGRTPIQSEADRLAVVSALKPVDYACLGDREDMYLPVLRIRPDLIILGKDQDADPAKIRSDLARRNLRVKVIRSRAWDSGDLSKTTRIVDEIKRRSLGTRRKNR